MRHRLLTFVCALVVLPLAGFADPVEPTEQDVLSHPFFASFQLAQAYDCSDTACSRLSSCEEACYKLTVCGQGKRDGDSDGIPCENLCSRRCP